MAKEITFGDDLRKRLFKGVKTTVDAVSSTLGPSGRCVLIENSYGYPTSTKDGVTVAKAIELDDPVENMGATIVKNITGNTDQSAGDGTTTASVLTLGILEEGLKAVDVGVNPIKLRNGIQDAVDDVIKELKDSYTREVETEEQISQVASISANNDKELGDLIAQAIKTVGSSGVVTTGESSTCDTYMDFVEGMSFDKGFLSPYFCTDKDNLTVEYQKPYILMTDKIISNIQSILPILDKISREGKPLLIIAEDVEAEALSTIVINDMRGVFKVCAIKSPGFGDRKKEMLEDIAILTGGQVITDELGLSLETMTMDDLGMADSLTVTKNRTTIIGGYGEGDIIDERVAHLEKEVKECTSDYDKERLQERLARLAGGIAVIRVGDVSETALKEKKYIVEYALNATRAGIDEGIIAGGGTALCQISYNLKTNPKAIGDSDYMRGYNIVLDAITRPLKQIAENCGLSGDVVADKVQSSPKGMGFNALTGQYVDMIADGVIDPVKVTRLALLNASSVASLILTSSCSITTKPDPRENDPMNGMRPM